MTELHNDHAQQANNEGASIPMEEVDAVLRRIAFAIDRLPVQLVYSFRPELCRLIARERERLGLPKEAST